MDYSYDYTDLQEGENDNEKTNPGSRVNISRSYLYHVGVDLGLGATVQIHNRNMENSED